MVDAEAVQSRALAFGQQAHPDGDTFVDVVKDEVRRLVDDARVC